MGNNTDYSELYSSETAENISAADMSEEELAFIKKGKTKAKVIGIIYLVICGINTLKTLFDFSGGIAYWIGGMAAMILFIAIGVMFIKGKNGGRIALGVFFCICAALSLLIFVPSLISTAAYGSTALLFGVLSSLISLAIIGVPIWFTLFDKSVKAYCKSNKTTKN